MILYPEPMKITSPTLHATIIFTITVFVVIIMMSFIFKVEVVARGTGRVIPLSRVQVVQPEFSGKISAIHVRNGDQVEAGDLLIELDSTDANAELAKITAEQARLEIESARIDAMTDALLQDISVSDFVGRVRGRFSVAASLSAHPFFQEQAEFLEAEAKDLVATLAQITARKDANLKSEDVTNANIARVQASLDIQSERLRISEQLLKQGTASRSSFLDVQQAFTELARTKEVYLRELDQKITERAELESEQRRVISGQRSELLERHTQIEARLATLAEEERAARRRARASALNAPASGIVDQLKVFTVGGVAEAGNQLLRIVPTNIQLEIEGEFPNQDIGFVKKGQFANIRIDAYPSERYGFLKGTVSDIAADSTENSTGQWGYVVGIRPLSTFIDDKHERFPIRPGMTATIDITTDKRRIISYFFAPILQTIQSALGER